MPIHQHRLITVETQFLPDLSHSLDSEYTLENVRRELVGTCVEEYGYVLEIHRIVHVDANKFSAHNGLLWIRATVDATTLKPVKGDRFAAVVVDAQSVGMIAVVRNVMKCFVKTERCCAGGDTVVFTVLEIRYKNGVYETVGLEE